MTRRPWLQESPGAGVLAGVIGKVMVSTEEMLTQLIQTNVIVSTINQNSYIPSRNKDVKRSCRRKKRRGAF